MSRSQSRVSSSYYTPAEIDRIMAACDRAEHGRWFREFVRLILETGRRTHELLESQPWPHDKSLYAAFNGLLQTAGVESRNGFHGLRRAFYHTEGGVA